MVNVGENKNSLSKKNKVKKNEKEKKRIIKWIKVDKINVKNELSK